MDFKNKYLKYKFKYLQNKKLYTGGTVDHPYTKNVDTDDVPFYDPTYYTDDALFVGYPFDDPSHYTDDKLFFEYPNLYNIQDDHDLTLRAVQQKGSYLQYASEGLRKTSDIVYAAVMNDSMSLQYVDPNFKEIKHLSLVAIQKNHEAFTIVNGNLKSDINFILSAVFSGVIIDICDPMSLGSQMTTEVRVSALGG
jgi:hypothetical protein